MNPLTQVKNTQKITAREAASGISEQGSWHEKYKDSAYINIGLLPFDLTEGDLLAIFAQYGEVVDVNLVRDKATGKSRGFAFLAYEDQRSTVLAVDNLNGARVVGRTIRVDHVANYKKKVEEDEEEEQRKREERGVCYAFQRGECNRGAACKFSHDEQRHANTGWGKKDDGPTWGRQRNGRSPPPPPWKQGSGLKDNPPPPWRRSSGQKDDPPPSRKENGSNKAPQTWEDNRQAGAQAPRRNDDRTRDDFPPSSSSSRHRISRMDEPPGRGRDKSQLARPSRTSDDIEDDHSLPAKRDNGLDSRRRDRSHRDVSPDSQRHGQKRDRQSSLQNERAGDVPMQRARKRRDDSPLRRRHDSQSEDDSPPQRGSGRRRGGSSPKARHDSHFEDDRSPKRRSGGRRDEDYASPKRRSGGRRDGEYGSPKQRAVKSRNDRDDSSPSAHRGYAQEYSQLRDEGHGSPRNADRKDRSAHQRFETYSEDDDASPRRRQIVDNDRNPRMEHRSSGTGRNRDVE